jgi:hypothetical protein
MYLITPPNRPEFQVMDVFQPGDYQIKAWIAPSSMGQAFVKVIETKTGVPFYIDSPVTFESVRLVGWSPEGNHLFPYICPITVSRGDWTQKYECRFELWYRSSAGTTTLLAAHTQEVQGPMP